MNESNTKLEVFYRGNRAYIQGSLIISLVYDYLTERNKDKDIEIRRVKFKKILNGPLIISFSPDQTKTLAIGEIITSIDGEKQIVYLAEDDLSVEIPKRCDNEPSRLIEYENEGHMQSHAVFRPVETCDDLFCSLVETVKRSVSESFEAAKDVWFIGLQKSNIAFNENIQGMGGVLHVREGSETWHDNRVITSSNVVFEFDNNVSFGANILFSCITDSNTR